MIKTLALLPSLVLFASASLGQVIAGHPANGEEIVYPDAEVSITLQEFFAADSIAIDLDCDASDDLEIIINAGAPPIDAPSVVVFEAINPDLSLCITNDAPPTPIYYEFGDTILCESPDLWSTTPHTLVSSYGGWVDVGPAFMDTVYVAYNLDGITGWVNFSFNLSENTSGTAAIHKYSSACSPTDLLPDNVMPHIQVYPNPTADGRIRITGVTPETSVEISTSFGQRLGTFDVHDGLVDLPDQNGVFLLRFYSNEGCIGTKVVVAQ